MIKLLPVLMAIFGIGAGVGAGFYFQPEAEAPETEQATTPEACVPTEDAPTATAFKAPVVDPATREYVRLNNQFIIPVVPKDRVNALVVLSLSLEVPKGQSQSVFDREPKLRDLFLQVLFNHANMGGFEGTFTDIRKMNLLRKSLRDAAHSVLGDTVSDVLITDIVRQDS